MNDYCLKKKSPNITDALVYARKISPKWWGRIYVWSHTQRIWHVQLRQRCKNSLSLFDTLPIRETSNTMSWPQSIPKGEILPGRIVCGASSLNRHIFLPTESCRLSLPTYWKDRRTYFYTQCIQIHGQFSLLQISCPFMLWINVFFLFCFFTIQSQILQVTRSLLFYIYSVSFTFSIYSFFNICFKNFPMCILRRFPWYSHFSLKHPRYLNIRSTVHSVFFFLLKISRQPSW